MLDLKFLRDNPEAVKAALKLRRFDLKEIDLILDLDKEKRGLQRNMDDIRAQKNAASEHIAKEKGTEKKKHVTAMQKLSKDEKEIVSRMRHLEEELLKKMELLPNLLHPSVPPGMSEEENETVRTWGEKPQRLEVPWTDHLLLGTALDILEIEKAAIMSGTRFYYLKGDGARLHNALMQYALDKTTSQGFIPVLPPVLVKEHAMWGTGFFPADRNEIYHVNPEDDDLYLIGTSEVPLNMLHAGDILPAEKLPLRYAALSTCFRREAGTWGKDTHGIIRVHQFDKVEMFSFCHPEKSEEEHGFLLSIEESIMKELGFHYRVVNICAGELGPSAAKKYDIEVWMPTQNRFRELTSCSNCTDFQARRTNIRYKEGGENRTLHTLNGTVIAGARTLAAIIEHYQNVDRSVTIPEVLRPYLQGQSVIRSHML